MVQKVSYYFLVAVIRKKSLIILSKEYLLGRVQTILYQIKHLLIKMSKQISWGVLNKGHIFRYMKLMNLLCDPFSNLRYYNYI